ncbi:MAG: ABC transporter substrate-binding protein [Candidatus Limivicinus sp.]|jgi:ABC-type Fe3+ transport system substrate-binding protein
MKKIIALLLLFSLGLSACGTTGQEEADFAPAEENCLKVVTAMNKALWETFLMEFQEQSGIWVSIRELNPEELTDAVRHGEADLILGCGADTALELEKFLAPLTVEGMENKLWTPVMYQLPVIIYNPYLIRKNPPEGWGDLISLRWQGSFAVSDPNRDDMSRAVLPELLQLFPEREGRELMEAFSKNTGGVYGSADEVLDAVVEGSFPMGIVPESAALRAAAGGEKISIVYPREGALLCPEMAALPKKSEHPEQAGRLISFILDEKTQRHGWEYLCLRPVLEEPEYLPEKPLFTDEENEDSEGQGPLEILNEIWKREA